MVSECGFITQYDLTQDYQRKANGLCLPPTPAASAASTVAEVPPAWPPVLWPGSTMKCSSAVPAH